MLIGWFMVINATFNYISVISWRSALLVEETGVSGEKHHKTKPYQTRNVRKKRKKKQNKTRIEIKLFRCIF
jgi:hypothetical protein